MNRKIVIGACLGLAGVVVVAAGGFGPLWQPEKKPASTAPSAQPTKPDVKVPAKPDLKQPEKAPDAAGMPDIMPGAAHKQLAKMVGDWETSTTSTMGGPDATKGTAKIAAILEGRFFKEEATGEMMGHQFTSFKTIGYNNGAKKYESMWLYTRSTAMMTLNGTSTDDGKTITLAATAAGPGGKNEEMTVVMKWTDDNTFTVTLSFKMNPAAPEEKMETTYTRKK